MSWEMNPQMMQYNQPGYPPQAKPPQQLAGQMQGLSLGPGPNADPYRRPAQVANGAPGVQTNGPPGPQAYRPQNYQPAPQSYPPAKPPQNYQQFQGPPRPGFPPQAFPNQPQPGFAPASQGLASPNQQHPGFPPTNQGPPPNQQQPGFPPTNQGPTPNQQQPGFPPTNQGPPSNQQQTGFPPTNQGPTPNQQQTGYPPKNYAAPPAAGFPPPGHPPRQQQYPPQTTPTGYYPPQQAAQPNYPANNQFPPQGNPPYDGFSAPNYQQPQPARKIEPDHLPSVIQVMQEDEKAHSGVFVTNEKGSMPPLMTTNFTVQDGGNCSPRFMRSTLYSVPCTTETMKMASLSFSMIISPLARLKEGECPPPLVDMGEIGPVRCIRCKAYMCPYMQFIDGGRRFHCLLCKANTEVPAEYFQHLDNTGLRTDRFQRPELILGAYEFVATKDYCKNNIPPNPPAMVFVIDVSYNNVRSGLVHLLCARMKEILRAMPRMRVGFITYNSSVHFYNIKSCLAAPQMVIVGDVNEMFMPLLDGFLADSYESEAVIDLLMEEIPKQFADTRETETILLPAIQAGMEALKAAECAGKLLVFHSSLPIAEAPGKLKNRDDRKLLATEKEKTVLVPQNRVYNDLGQECVQSGVSVDLFLFNNAYADLATIGQVSRLTGGEIFKYTYFQADTDGDRLIEDIKIDVSRETAYDAIMRVRTSTGVRATDFYGHFFMSNTTDIELAAMDSDKALAVEIKHDDKLTEEDGVYIQVALLYTHVTGQRRLRILNLSLKTCSQLADMYRSVDLDTLINFYAKQGVTKLLEHTPKQVKETLTTVCATTLACYRKHCASPSSVGQLILPECIKLLPLFVNTLLKSDAIAGGSDMTVDDRSFAMHTVLVMDINSSIVYFYPRLLSLHTSPNFTPVRCSIDGLREDGIYLLDNGVHMFLWLGLNVNPELVTALFGVPSVPQVDADKPFVPVLDNVFNQAVRDIIAETRKKRHRHMRLTIVKQRDKLELVMKHFLVEDSGVDGSPSYIDFLCFMHKEIRSLLS